MVALTENSRSWGYSRSGVRSGRDIVPRLAQHAEGSLGARPFAPGLQREGQKCTSCSEHFQHLRADWLSFAGKWWVSKGSQSVGYAKKILGLLLASWWYSQTIANLLFPCFFLLFFLLNEIWVLLGSSHSFLITGVTVWAEHTWKEMQNLNSFKIEAPRFFCECICFLCHLIDGHIPKKASAWRDVDVSPFC